MWLKNQKISCNNQINVEKKIVFFRKYSTTDFFTDFICNLGKLAKVGNWESYTTSPKHIKSALIKKLDTENTSYCNPQCTCELSNVITSY